MNLFSDALVKEACEASSVSGLSDATIGEVLPVIWKKRRAYLSYVWTRVRPVCR